MKKIRKSLWVLAPVLGLSTISLISCSYNVESPQRIEEDKKLQDKIVARYVDNAFVETILAQKVYKFKPSDIKANFNDTNSAFFKEAQQAFNFYQNYQLKQDQNFTYTTYSKLLKDQVLNSNDLKVLQKDLGSGSKFEIPAFKILYNNLETGIAEIVNKLLLVKFFLLNQDSKDIKDSKIYKDGTSDKASYTTKNILESLDTNEKDFFLMKLLLEKQPAQVWKFESTNTIDLATFAATQINDADSFNAIVLADAALDSKTTQKEENFEFLNANDSIDLHNLYGYQGILYNQGVSSRNDLDYSLTHLKNDFKIRSGFLDDSNRIFSQDQLSLYSKWNQVKLAPIKLKSTFDTNKEKEALLATDIDIEADSNSLQNATYSVEKIYPSLITSNKKSADVVVKITIKSDNQKIKDNSYFYKVMIDWNNKDNITYTPQINKDGEKLPQEVPASIVSLSSDASKISISYVNKIVPLFDKVVTDEKTKETKRYFSLDNTPWSSLEQQEILAFSLFLADQNLIFNDVKSYFENMGYKINVKDSVIKLDDTKDEKK
ncbi:HinT-interacting membrane complex lipoprotein P60 [Mesomycoplasma hyorhinis]|uniref:HinT-interacting membrane complex lipoprotein P60 n=1 Tax=Mesomycoplasma hyorhinis TaxID=2100 RepID=UPI0030F45116